MSVQAPVTWDGHTARELAARCKVPRVDLYEEVDSTLDVAHLLAEGGAASGTLVVADHQRAGRGRLGRSWSSPSGQGVWCTVIERPSDPRALDVLSIRVGLCAAEALDKFVDSPVSVKWPNDLVTRSGQGGQRGKHGGILVEARWAGPALQWAAVGVGINVVAPTDVRTAAGLRHGVQRVDVLAAIVGAIRSASSMEGWLTPDEIRRCAVRDALRGRRVESPAIGMVTGIDASGALLVETAGGLERHRAGTIRFAEEEEEEGEGEGEGEST